jgi:hypothetical protein
VDAFARQWDARIAPISEPQLVWEDGKLVRESFAEHVFDGVKKREVPVVAAHDESLCVGYIDDIFRRDGWFHAAFRLDRSLPGSEVAAECIRCGMPVSLGFRTVLTRRVDNTVEHRVVLLDELSLLGQGMKPAYKGAEVMSSLSFPERTKEKLDALLDRAKNLPPLSPLVDSPTTVRDDFDDYRPAIFDELERMLGYRVTHENFEAANTEASRTPLDKLYDEVYGRQKVLDPQVLIRPGIGQVLGVR